MSDQEKIILGALEFVIGTYDFAFEVEDLGDDVYSVNAFDFFVDGDTIGKRSYTFRVQWGSWCFETGKIMRALEIDMRVHDWKPLTPASFYKKLWQYEVSK